jgi:hypothetical protein
MKIYLVAQIILFSGYGSYKNIVAFSTKKQANDYAKKKNESPHAKEVFEVRTITVKGEKL